MAVNLRELGIMWKSARKRTKLKKPGEKICQLAEQTFSEGIPLSVRRSVTRANFFNLHPGLQMQTVGNDLENAGIEQGNEKLQTLGENIKNNAQVFINDPTVPKILPRKRINYFHDPWILARCTEQMASLALQHPQEPFSVEDASTRKYLEQQLGITIPRDIVKLEEAYDTYRMNHLDLEIPERKQKSYSPPESRSIVSEIKVIYRRNDQVTLLSKKGYSEIEIAYILGISTRNVRTYSHNSPVKPRSRYVPRPYFFRTITDREAFKKLPNDVLKDLRTSFVTTKNINEVFHTSPKTLRDRLDSIQDDSLSKKETNKIPLEKRIEIFSKFSDNALLELIHLQRSPQEIAQLFFLRAKTELVENRIRKLLKQERVDIDLLYFPVPFVIRLDKEQ